MTTSHPAGWYPDPQGRSDHRYFDGTAWTDQVSRGGVVGTDPVQPAPVVATPLAAPAPSAKLPHELVGDAAAATATAAADPPAPVAPAPSGSEIGAGPEPAVSPIVAATEAPTTAPPFPPQDDARPVGWYPDPGDPNSTSYWDGTRITSRRVWNGSQWVDGDGSPAPTVAAGATANSFDAKLQSVSAKIATVKVPPRLGFIGLAVGCAAIALGSLLPWAEASGPLGASETDGPQSGAAVMFLILAGIALAVGWPLLRDGISRVRAVGLAVTVGLLGLFALTNWKELLDLRSQAEDASNGSLGFTVEVTPGGGLLLYTLGVVVLVAVVVLAILQGRTATRAD